MEQNYDGIEISCECGCEHVLDPMCVEQNTIEKFKENLCQSRTKSVRVFLNRKFMKNSIIMNVIDEIRELGVVVDEEVLFFDFAQEISASSIVFKGEEYVVVAGDFKDIDVIKYYCKSIGLDLCVIVVDDFLDFSFSKYSRLYDGITYCFYRTVAPKHVICFDELLNSNSLKIKKYLELKSLAYFENALAGYSEPNMICKKINSKLMKAIKFSKAIKKVGNAFFLCVFLGRAMSFFGGTKNFFGAEMDVCGILEVKTKKSFFECYLLSSELMLEVYATALKNNLKLLNFDLNTRIDNIKRVLKLSAICCLGFVKRQKTIQELQKTTKLVSALRFMLAGLLEGKTMNISSNISKKDLLESLYVAPEFSGRFLMLNLLRDLGYLENLLK
ncbi:MAG: hypothetical protein IJW24_00475 [Clostridia bacterium]|nr:hypothetical protein [Clostridia bacterium]